MKKFMAGLFRAIYETLRTAGVSILLLVGIGFMLDESKIMDNLLAAMALWWLGFIFLGIAIFCLLKAIEYENEDE